MMKKIIVCFLVLLMLAVPVCAENYLIHDDEGLLQSHDVEKLETVYASYAQSHGFTPALVTVDDFGGLSAEEFAGQFYDIMAYPEDGILLLISLEEGQWYILTNGECYRRISNQDAQRIGESLVDLIQDGQYYAAFLQFPELAGEIFLDNEPDEIIHPDVAPAVPKKTYGKTIAISMGAGLLIGLITVGIMAAKMKTVRAQKEASDYVRPDSFHLTNSRDIFLYSNVHRTPKPKQNSSGGSHGGGSRGGAGGRL